MKSFMLSVAVFMALAGAVRSQSLLAGLERGGSMRLQPFDTAILDSGEPRNDLPCEVIPFKSQLDFDFLFQTGYRVSIPRKELAGSVNELTVLFRAVSRRRPDEPVYFAQKLRVPAMEENAEGAAVLTGEFLVGEGKYHVDWLVRDFQGRVCARFWDVEAKGSAGEASPDLAQDVIQPATPTPFQEDRPVVRERPDRLLHVKVIVNFAPQSLTGTSLGPEDLNGLVAILRKIGHEPRIGRYSIVACSLQAQQVFYRQESAPRIDLPALGEALQAVNLATIHFQQLEKNRETAFFSSLVAEEMIKDHADGLIFVGPKYPLDSDLPREVMDRLRGFDSPLFYMNYSLNPLSYPWRDAIGKIVKQLHGIEYTITCPRDLLSAWTDIVPRLLRARKTPAGTKAEF